eukprot:5673804-Amphidinium_carterae.1
MQNSIPGFAGNAMTLQGQQNDQKQSSLTQALAMCRILVVKGYADLSFSLGADKFQKLRNT